MSDDRPDYTLASEELPGPVCISDNAKAVSTNWRLCYSPVTGVQPQLIVLEV